jgi:AcrR family transcriptional regulator
MKEKILDKATDLFLTLGFKSVTMDDIATEMGISKKTIYQHFATKPLLVKEVTLHLFEKISCGIDSIRESKKNPIEELFEIKQFVLKHLKNESSSPIYQLQKYYPKIHSTLRTKQFDKMESCVTENLIEGIKKGLYRDTINVDIIARLYFAGMNSIKDLDLFPELNFNIIELQNVYLDYHLRGICTPKGIELLQTITNKQS